MLLNTTFEVVDHKNQERWIGTVTDFNDLGAFQRVVIEAQGSRLDILCGQCPSYRWIFLPDLEIGCMQASVNDVFWNTEKLCHLLNRKDSFSIVYGISFVLSEGQDYG